jgi:hypothetical protein
MKALNNLSNKTFLYKWNFSEELIILSDDWKYKKNSKSNKQYNKILQSKYEYIFNLFRINSENVD